MIFPLLAEQVGFAALVVGGAAGGYVNYVVRTRLAGRSKKDTPRPGKAPDKDAAVVPVLVESERASRPDSGEQRTAHAVRKRDAADAGATAAPKTTANAPDPSSTETYDVSDT